MADIRLIAPAAALLGLVPVAAFLLLRPAPVVWLALVNVALIAGSIYLALAPAGGGRASESAG